MYGAATDSNNRVSHTCITKAEDIYKLQGSKYVQSDMEDVYAKIKKDLENGKKVLFSGTPCQVAAVKGCLGKTDTGNLLSVDIICHGVPSPAVFEDLIRYYENKYGGKVENIDFRNKKKYKWEDAIQTFTVNGKEYDERMFMDIFDEGVIERDSCFKCPYKNIHREGDITIGDFWGIDSTNPDFNDHKGVSLIICNTPEGSVAFENIKQHLEYFETTENMCSQKALVKPNVKPKSKKRFWRYYNKFGIRYAYIHWNLLRIKRRIFK